MAAEWRNPCAVISPTPRALQAARSRKLNARLENGAPEYPANTNCDAAKADSAGSHDPAAFNFLLEGLPLEERCTQASGNGHILEDASLIPSPKLFIAGAGGPPQSPPH